MARVAPCFLNHWFVRAFRSQSLYQNNPKTIAELKLAITQNICAIKREECARVIDNFARRLQECLRRNGGHLEHVF